MKGGQLRTVILALFGICGVLGHVEDGALDRDVGWLIRVRTCHIADSQYHGHVIPHFCVLYSYHHLHVSSVTMRRPKNTFRRFRAGGR